MSDTRVWVSQQDAADHWDVDVKTLRRWISEGRLPAYKVGRQIRIRMVDLEKLAEQIPTAS